MSLVEESDKNIEFGFPIIPEKTDAALDELHNRARGDYKKWKRTILEWLTIEGKEPDRLKGYGEESVRKTNYRIGQIMRWLWDERGYTTELTPEDADKLMRELGRYSEYEDANLNNFIKAIDKLFRYYNHEKGREIDWSCNFSTNEPRVTNRDYFKKDEFRDLYEAALGYGTIKHYKSCTPGERDSLKGHLAARFDKEKDSISVHDFERANSFKIPSLVSTSLDLGLRPIEIARAKPEWIQLDEGVVKIPAKESTKNRDNWECVLSEKSIRTLRNWLGERQTYDEYHGKEALWLNAKHNRYKSQSLNYLLDKLVDKANIKPAGRDLTWYSIRHGTATLWANEEDIHDAREQLRHVDVRTTLGYSHSATDKRRNAVNSKY